jgi:hypothetical protein
VLKEKVIKAFIGVLPLAGKPDVLAAFIQYPSQVVIASFNSSNFNGSFETGGSIIPILQSSGLVINPNQLSVFVHTID